MLKVEIIMLRYNQRPMRCKTNSVHSLRKPVFSSLVSNWYKLLTIYFYFSMWHPIKYGKVMSAAQGSARSLYFEIQFCLSLFELLTFEFKEMTKQKRKEGLYSIFLKGRFRRGQGAHVVVCTFILFLFNQSLSHRLASQYKTTIISKTQH